MGQLQRSSTGGPGHGALTCEAQGPPCPPRPMQNAGHLGLQGHALAREEVVQILRLEVTSCLLVFLAWLVLTRGGG